MKKVLKKALVLCLVATMTASVAGCTKGADETAAKESAPSESTETAVQPFPKFTGTDMEDARVDESIFQDHAATVVNFWFTGCTACVQEMPDLENLSHDLEKEDVAFVGLLVEPDRKKLAQDILEAKGATYRNIVPEMGGEMEGLVQTIFAFPTTVVVDRDGNIVGDAVVGSLTTDERIEQLMERVDDVVKEDK
ncbi:MAG: TlpA disulfide reductase family protein [Peptoniphilus sp.]|nr:TlpA disulfide reductase family protein [Peptoniphilus sp.]MDD7362634.1 TlpA disulfide reductase family protein [Bacillota bacterium]MDY6044967.1 TlpA disulfide reductase family protein [Peptoniphilus sp.]